MWERQANDSENSSERPSWTSTATATPRRDVSMDFAHSPRQLAFAPSHTKFCGMWSLNPAAALVDLDQPLSRQRRYHPSGDVERTAEEVEGGVVGVGVLGPIARAREVLERLGPLLAVLEMVRQLFVMLGETIGVEILDGVAHGAVQFFAPLHQEAVVGDVLDHCVLEDVGRLRQEALLVDDLERLELAQEAVDLGRQPGDPLQQPDEELPADHRRELDGPVDHLGQAIP